MLGVLRGTSTPHARPDGERAWFLADSMCRQRLWGTWTGALYRPGDEDSFDPVTDHVAVAWSSWCSALPERFLRRD